MKLPNAYLSPAELNDLTLLGRKLRRTLEKQGAPMSVRRFYDDLVLAIKWHNDNKEEK